MVCTIPSFKEAPGRGVRGIPNVLTRVLGEPFEASYHVAGKEHRASRRGECYQIYVAELSRHWFGELCVAPDAYRALKRGGTIALKGRRLWLGIDPAQYNYHLPVEP